AGVSGLFATAFPPETPMLMIARGDQGGPGQRPQLGESPLGGGIKPVEGLPLCSFLCPLLAARGPLIAVDQGDEFRDLAPADILPDAPPPAAHLSIIVEPTAPALPSHCATPLPLPRSRAERLRTLIDFTPEALLAVEGLRLPIAGTLGLAVEGALPSRR